MNSFLQNLIYKAREFYEGLTGGKPAPTGLTGVEINRQGFAIVHVVATNTQYKITNCEYVKLSSRDMLNVEMENAVYRNGLEDTYCSLTLSTNDYQVLQMDAPNVGEEELHEALKWQVQDFIEYPVEQAIYDYIQLPADLYKDTQKVLVVVSSKGQLRYYANVINEAGLKLTVIDSVETAFRNLFNVLPANYHNPYQPQAEAKPSSGLDSDFFSDVQSFDEEQPASDTSDIGSQPDQQTETDHQQSENSLDESYQQTSTSDIEPGSDDLSEDNSEQMEQKQSEADHKQQTEQTVETESETIETRDEAVLRIMDGVALLAIFHNQQPGLSREIVLTSETPDEISDRTLQNLDQEISRTYRYYNTEAKQNRPTVCYLLPAKPEWQVLEQRLLKEMSETIELIDWEQMLDMKRDFEDNTLRLCTGALCGALRILGRQDHETAN